jgi:hypothetical protein
MKGLSAFLLTGALLAPQFVLASESRLATGDDRRAAFSEKLPLPPVPYLDTMPWITFGSQPRGPRIDTLLLPDFNLSPSPKNSALANSEPALSFRPTKAE